MKMGLMVGATEGPDGTIDGVIAAAQAAEERGFEDLWMANIFGLDAISTLALVGRETKSIGLGTAVTPTYPRHPTAIAQQALTAGAASGGRFTLGIGLSHQVVIEGMLGLSYDKPARHMREYLEILMPLLRGETVNFAGEQYTANNVTLSFPGMQPVPVLVAALGPVMLKIAGELADGTVTWMTGPNTLESYIIPSISKAASAAGKSAPRIAAGFPVVATDDVPAAREMIGKVLQIYGMLPSYRAMLDKEGVAGPAELALAGSEAQIKDSIKRLRDIGVTEFCGNIVAENPDSYKRTLDCLASA